MALARLLHHHNASLAVPYNCRGWNSGGLTLQHLVSSCDVCFIQEHWLHTDQLHKLNAFNYDFLSVAVSGMDSGSLLCGRPYGGCSVLYRKSLSSCIIPLASSSNRFCGIKVIDSNGSSILMISLYMPSECRQSYFTEYLNTLGELEGLIETEKCDVNMLIGDFNVDFCRDGCQSRLLLDFMSELDLCACNLSFCNSIYYTYERDDGLVRSWIDHVVCTNSFSSLVSDVYRVQLGSNVSDHYPHGFIVKVDCVTIPVL